MDALVDSSLDWSALAADDLGDLADLRRAIDWFDDPIDPVDAGEFARRFREASDDPGHDAVVGRDCGGSIVAYGWNVLRANGSGVPQIWLDGGVHPASRHHQIGRRLLGWQVARAEEWLGDHRAQGTTSLWLGARVDERVVPRSHLMRGAGLLPERWYLDLRCPIGPADADHLPVGLDTPHGRVELMAFRPEHSEAVRQLHNDIYAREGAAPVGVRDWQVSLLRPGTRQTCSWIAASGDEIVGYALNSSYSPLDASLREGWTDRMAVAHSWRGQGIGSALLAASRHSFGEAGFDTAGAGLDTRDPEHALEAYHNAGYQVSETVALYSRELHLDAEGRLGWEAPGRLG